MCEIKEKSFQNWEMHLWGQWVRLAICQEGRGSEKLCGLVVARESKGGFNGMQSFPLWAFSSFVSRKFHWKDLQPTPFALRNGG